MKNWLKISLAILIVIVLVGVGIIIGRGSGAGIEHSVQVTINVGVSGDFALVVDPAEVSCTKGDVLTFAISATLVDGFDADIQLAVAGLPDGSWILESDVLAPTALTTTLTVNTAALQPNSSYVMTVNAHDI